MAGKGEWSSFPSSSLSLTSADGWGASAFLFLFESLNFENKHVILSFFEEERFEAN